MQAFRDSTFIQVHLVLEKYVAAEQAIPKKQKSLHKYSLNHYT